MNLENKSDQGEPSPLILWQEDISKGLLYGGISGAIFSSITSDEFYNFINGKGFRSNEAVFKDFMRGRYSTDYFNRQQDVLDYFGFEGKFDPHNAVFQNNNNPAETFTNGEIIYNFSAFNGNFDKLHFIADHEMMHRSHILDGISYNDSFDIVKAREEYNTYVENFKHQWRYPHHNMPLGAAINMYGTSLNYSHNRFLQYSGYAKQPWWFFIYKIPRRW